MTTTHRQVRSLCVPHECRSILRARGNDTNSCSAVTMSATRWTEAPPQQHVAKAARQAAQAGGIARAKPAHRTCIDKRW